MLALALRSVVFQRLWSKGPEVVVSLVGGQPNSSLSSLTSMIIRESLIQTPRVGNSSSYRLCAGSHELFLLSCSLVASPKLHKRASAVVSDVSWTFHDRLVLTLTNVSCDV